MPFRLRHSEKKKRVHKIRSDVKTLDDPKNMKIRPKYDYLLPKKATKIRLLGTLKGD